ncbi:chromosome partitioning protein ParA [Vibrio cidicii]|uniref:Chromosome partitioning protein ParA n=1 Tax=Vibrio cidicii TaxID=1763883 RepID=A0ABR5VZ66_9VIBR|nr:hypothetical protein [Vibrio cidicii]KYN84582.1 chromosome partitioning protein ParA [Vibrio cidicii]
MTRTLMTMLVVASVAGCNSSGDSRSAPPSLPFAAPSIQIEKTDELIATLKSQKTINDQLMVIYESYEPLLDRSNSLTGPDTNQNGIRDDIEAFIDALEVTEPVRNVLKQKARYSQEAISHDFESVTDENEMLSYKISEKYNKVLACYDYLKVPVEDSTQVSRTVRALTYNTKARTLAYLAYNRLLNGTGSKLLSPEERYCE